MEALALDMTDPSWTSRPSGELALSQEISQSLVVLDRDGVLNDLIDDEAGTWRPPYKVNELTIKTSALHAMESFKEKNIAVYVFTNQPDVARGKLTLGEAVEINKKILESFPWIHAVAMCPHDSSDGCHCRKPDLGMIEQICADFGRMPNQLWVIGDRWVDILSGSRSGAQTILISEPYSWDATSIGGPPINLQPTYVVSDLVEASLVVISAHL